MTSMTYLRRIEPTLSLRKFVGEVLTWDWIARSLIAFSHGLLAEDLPLKEIPIEGDLSEWIERLEKRPFAAFSSRGSGWRGVKGLWQCCQLLWMFHDLENSAKELLSKLPKLLPERDLTEIENSWRNRDLAGLNSRSRKILERAGSNWKLDVPELLETLKATQVVFRCFALYKGNPRDLIEQARQGNQPAVLELIKLDKLFLTDACTQQVLRKAALEQDDEFLRKLVWAIEYKAEFTRRDAFQVYYYGLFALGIKLPPVSKLQQILDPEGNEFPGASGFDRFFERSRKDLTFLPIESDS